MRRSASASIVSDQLSANSPSPSPSPPRINSVTDSEDGQLLLPRYDPKLSSRKEEQIATQIRRERNPFHSNRTHSLRRNTVDVFKSSSNVKTVTITLGKTEFADLN